MKLLVMMFTLITAVLVQGFTPRWGLLKGCPLPVLLSVVIYYALVREPATMVVCAVLAGLVRDALGLAPLGISSFGFVLVGFALHRYREIVFAQKWITHILLGSLASLAMTIIVFTLFVVLGQLELTPSFVLYKLILSVLLGAFVVPLAFRLLEFMDRKIGLV